MAKLFKQFKYLNNLDVLSVLILGMFAYRVSWLKIVFIKLLDNYINGYWLKD